MRRERWETEWSLRHRRLGRASSKALAGTGTPIVHHYCRDPHQEAVLQAPLHHRHAAQVERLPCAVAVWPVPRRREDEAVVQDLCEVLCGGEHIATYPVSQKKKNTGRVSQNRQEARGGGTPEDGMRFSTSSRVMEGKLACSALR